MIHLMVASISTLLDFGKKHTPLLVFIDTSRFEKWGHFREFYCTSAILTNGKASTGHEASSQ